MARNLLAEHRISQERFDRFRDFAGSLAAIDAVREALAEYHSTEVRPLKDGSPPAYERPENKNNAVELPPRSHLATVLDLTGLGRVYAEAAASFKLTAFRDYAITNPTDATQINEFLSSKLSERSQREDFLKAILRALSLYRKHVDPQIRPTWAAEWNSVRGLLNPDVPESWLQAVGVPRDQPVWLAVFRYPARSKKREIKLFRPTQLDAGWNAHHFPSPPHADLRVGGHTMWLCSQGEMEPENARVLVSEYVHAQTDFTIADWRRAGRLAGFTGRPVAGELEQQRREHWLLLQSRYKDILVWMPEFA